MAYDLLLTLGHNSSAILVNATLEKIMCGYEEERLTQLKSDSKFPINAIQQCLSVAGVKEVDRVFVTHWAPDGLLSSMSAKHWQPDALPPHKSIVTHGRDMSHHDTHAHAAAWYAYSEPGLKRENTMLFVVDGFGNYGEHISIYQMTGYGPKLVRRFFGYDCSLGLMYQYMTAFLGMKMHEDEYKILGYETKLQDMDVDMTTLHKLINKEITRYLDHFLSPKQLVGEFDPVLRLDALPALQKRLIDHWLQICGELEISDPTSFEGRVILGYFVQAVLEGVVLTLAKIYKPTNLICSGGVFYNVKLNRRLLDVIEGKLCVYPLAGDQGNSLGLYVGTGNSLQWPGHLFWGERPKREKDQLIFKEINGLRFVTDRKEAVEIATDQINGFGMVNIVRGAMEFGPRALCYTSTLAMPSPAIVNRINRMNGRSTVMPMAPVMNRTEFNARMQMAHRLHLSEQHMITALPYKPGRFNDCLGAAHQYSTEVTGRPQVIDEDWFMDQIFSYFPLLINTSFNIHGKPIVFEYGDVVDHHNYERQSENITTIYLEEDE